HLIEDAQINQGLADALSRLLCVLDALIRLLGGDRPLRDQDLPKLLATSCHVSALSSIYQCGRSVLRGHYRVPYPTHAFMGIADHPAIVHFRVFSGVEDSTIAGPPLFPSPPMTDEVFLGARRYDTQTA